MSAPLWGPPPSNSSRAEKYRAAWFRVQEISRGINLLQHPLGALISEVLDKTGSRLISDYPGTSGVALSLRYRDGEILLNEPCLTFFVHEISSAHNIPRYLLGVPTDVVEAGRPVLHSGGTHVPGSRLNPIEPGCSISHFRVSSGTFGCLVQDSLGIYILSCAHVLSDRYPSQYGDPIVHPGATFGGTLPNDQVATFERQIPLVSGNCLADAAIARLTSATSGSVPAAIRYIGTKPSSTVALGSVGVLVQKSGDQTGRTRGIVIGLNGRIGPYSINGVNNIHFMNAIVTNGMADGGDSGSILMTNQHEAIGVLFGGLQYPGQSGYVAHYYSPIDVVLQQLGVTLV